MACNLSGLGFHTRFPHNWLKAKKSVRLRTWEISRIKGTPAAILGRVEARDAEDAIKKAIEEFGITDPEHQKRLVARAVR